MSKFRVIISHPVPQPAIDVLKDTCKVIFATSPEDLVQKLQTVDAVLTFGGSVKYNEELLQKIKGSPLKIVANMGVGMDHIDVAALKKNGILASNTAGSLDNSVAEVAVALTLSAGHRFKEGFEVIKNDQWTGRDPLWMCGIDLYQSTVGIVGLGCVGRAIAKRIHSFEASRILYCGNTPKDYAKEFDAEFVQLDTLLQESDFVILACPLTKDTKHLINADRLKLMKKTSVLVNVSRGDVVHQEDLAKALEDGTIFAAGLDVMTPEPLPCDNILVSLKNCVLSPHLGSATYATRTRMAYMAAINIYNALHGKPVPQLVEP